MKSKAISGIVLALLIASIVIANIGTVLAQLEADFDGDKDVDIQDVRRCARAFGSMDHDDPATSRIENATWDPVVDIFPEGGDGYINIFDLRQVCKYYGYGT